MQRKPAPGCAMGHSEHPGAGARLEPSPDTRIIMTAAQPLEVSPESGPGKPDAMARRLLYLCLQQTVEGQASHARVHGVIARLRRRGWSVDLREIEADRSRGHGRLYFLWHYLKPQLQLWFRAAPAADAMYI